MRTAADVMASGYVRKMSGTEADARRAGGVPCESCGLLFSASSLQDHLFTCRVRAANAFAAGIAAPRKGAPKPGKTPTTPSRPSSPRGEAGVRAKRKQERTADSSGVNARSDDARDEDLLPGPDWTRCTICQAKLKSVNLPRHEQRHNTHTRSVTGLNAPTLVQCSICKIRMETAVFPAHNARNHAGNAKSSVPQATPTKKKRRAVVSAPAKRQSGANPYKHKAPRSSSEQETERALDGSRDYWRYREKGAFGSHPLSTIQIADAGRFELAGSIAGYSC